MRWLEGEESAERLLIEAIKADTAKARNSATPGRRSTKSMPAVKRSSANIPAKRVMPPSLTDASARRETLQVRADWLIEEAEQKDAAANKRASKPPPAPRPKRAIPPPLPREDKD